MRQLLVLYLLLPAKRPKEIITQQELYGRLWLGEMSYDGNNKPYEWQISDHKRKIIAQIKKGIAGKIAVAPGELETIIYTRTKVGYILNVGKANVLILRKGDFRVIAFLFLLELGQFFSDWLLDVPEVLCLC